MHDEKCTKFNELSLFAFVKKLRCRVVLVNYVFGCSDWNHGRHMSGLERELTYQAIRTRGVMVWP